MKKYLTEKKETEFSRILNPGINGPGRSRLLTVEEDDIISQRFVHDVRRGLPMDVDKLRALMSMAVADGREVLLEFPSFEAVKYFTARHSELTYRRTENKEAAKLHAESYGHIQTYVDVFRDVDLDFPGLLQDPDRL